MDYEILLKDGKTFTVKNVHEIREDGGSIMFYNKNSDTPIAQVIKKEFIAYYRVDSMD